ncbi:MAG: sigma-70 family RNA polymerase sigma factor [Oscillospiraceae bacterium]|nr:sigma-70 family RNA polymerase sigma factor [Oscillospiraceae bacterium]
MKGIEYLNNEQKELVENHLDIVKWAIYSHITVKESVYGFSYDDLFQEGCIWLCKAAATYNGELAQFVTYAQVVVKNGLLTYCKKMWKQHKYAVNLSDISPDTDDGVNGTDADNNIAEDEYNSFISDTAIFDLFKSIKSEYDGITRLGIEALELKVKGYTGAEIAALWGVKQNHIGAWITRAKKKLRQNKRFMAELQT